MSQTKQRHSNGNFAEGNTMSVGSGAPEGNQSNLSHGLYTDIDQYYENADATEQIEIERVADSILERAEQSIEEDRAIRLGTQLQIANRASAWIMENGVTRYYDGRMKLQKPVKKLRRLDKRVMKELVELGVY